MKLERKVEQVVKVTKDKWDDSDFTDLLEYQENQETSDHQDHQDKLAHKDEPEILEAMVNQEMLDQSDPPVTKDRLVMKVHLDPQERTEGQEMLDLQDNQEPQDPQVICLVFLLVVSSIDSKVAKKDQDGTEANDRSMQVKMQHKKQNWTSSFQGVTTCSRTSPTSGKSLPTNTSNTKVWVASRCPLTRVQICSK